MNLLSMTPFFAEDTEERCVFLGSLQLWGRIAQTSVFQATARCIDHGLHILPLTQLPQPICERPATVHNFLRLRG